MTKKRRITNAITCSSELDMSEWIKGTSYRSGKQVLSIQDEDALVLSFVKSAVTDKYARRYYLMANNLLGEKVGLSEDKRAEFFHHKDDPYRILLVVRNKNKGGVKINKVEGGYTVSGTAPEDAKYCVKSPCSYEFYTGENCLIIDARKTID